MLLAFSCHRPMHSTSEVDSALDENILGRVNTIEGLRRLGRS